MQMALISSLMVLVVVPMWFICHRVYKDGVLGRIALAGIVFNAAIMLGAHFLDGWVYNLPYEVIVLISSFACFIVWHLYRFERRVVQSKKAEDGEIDRRRLLT